MYLRHTTIRKNGKTHTFWRLVRSVRVGDKVRQETVAQLGELDAAGRVRARALAEGHRGRRTPAGPLRGAGVRRARGRRPGPLAPRTRPPVWRRLAGAAPVAGVGTGCGP